MHLYRHIKSKILYLGSMENKLDIHFTEIVQDLLSKSQYIAIGIFSLDGNILESNEAMRYFLDAEKQDLQPKNQFVNPTFSSFIIGNNSGVVFDGLLTLGDFQDSSYVLQAKVIRKENKILVFAEADVRHLFDENKKMSNLNQLVNNLQRQLIKEKLNLQNTLTELKETQQMLIHSEKMNAMGKLVAGVAHELNNPMAFVYSNIFSIEKYIGEVFQSYGEVEELVKNSDNPELVDGVAKIHEKNELDYLMEDLGAMIKESKTGIERVKAIILDLRRFSRLDESDIKHVDLIENIRSTIAIARSEISRKNIEFEFSGPEELHVNCYPGQLNQAVLNILLNAIYAVETGGSVKLTVSKDEKNSIIVVKDNGSGIPDEIKNRIFDPFFTTKPVGDGTGLGLSITYKIIHDLHHGTIEVESESGKGTLIKLVIPGKMS